MLGLDVPLVQAPIGSAATPALAAAVSNAGGLGMLAGTWMRPEALASLIRETARATARPFGVNLVLPWPPEERLRVALGAGVRMISFFWGDPAPYVPVVHAAGGTVLHTVGSVDEARLAIACGVDVLVAQGVEAGGHVCGTTPLHELIPAVRAVAGSVPVIAAGGIGDPRAAAKVMALGADGVWLGTRFVACTESAAHPRYKRRIVDAGSGDTVLTGVFDIGWPDAPHRVIRNQTVEAWEQAGQPPPGRRPGEGEVVARNPGGGPVQRYEDVPPLEGMSGDVDALALYAGTSVMDIHEVLPARQIVEEFAPALA